MNPRKTDRSIGPDPSVFHEFSLVLFTALAIAGSGVGTTYLGLAFFGWVPWAPPKGVMR